MAAEAPHQDVLRQCGQVADRPDVVVGQRRRVLAPTPHRRSIASGARNSASVPAGTTTSPSGFFRSEAILATSRLAATPTDAVSSTSSRMACLIFRPTSSPVPNSASRAGQVQERLVDRERLDERREPAQDVHDLAADSRVLATVDRDEDRVGTQSAGRAQRHRRADAEDARLVRSSADYAAVVGPPAADDDRLAAQLPVCHAAQRRRRTRRGRRAGSSWRLPRRRDDAPDAMRR